MVRRLLEKLHPARERTEPGRGHASRSLAVRIKRLVDEPGGTPCEDQPQEDVPVLAGLEGLVVPAERKEPHAPDSGRADEAGVQNGMPLIVDRKRRRLAEG